MKKNPTLECKLENLQENSNVYTHENTPDTCKIGNKTNIDAILKNTEKNCDVHICANQRNSTITNKNISSAQIKVQEENIRNDCDDHNTTNQVKLTGNKLTNFIQTYIEVKTDCIQNEVKELVKYIRFDSMKLEDLKTLLEKYPILNTEEHLEMLCKKAMQQPTEKLLHLNKTRSIRNCPRLDLVTEYRYSSDMFSFPVGEWNNRIEISLIGEPLMFLGFVCAFKTISCYSAQHRTMNFTVALINQRTNCISSANFFRKVNNRDNYNIFEEDVLLDNFVLISEGDLYILEVAVESEGLKLAECTMEEFCCKVGKSKILFKVQTFDDGETVLPFRSIICFGK